MNRRELPLLGGIAGFLHWLEGLLIIVSGPLLTLGLGIALVDLLTGGALLTTQPGLLYTWATSQAVGVDAQLVGSAALLAVAFHQRRYWTALAYTALLVPLAYVAFIASDVFATQEADGITTAQALTRLGMDSTSWIVQRSALAVALVVLSGLLRYRPPAAEASAEDERAQLERELTLEPLRAQLRARKALGWRDLGRAITRGGSATAPVDAATHAQEGAGGASAGEMVEPTSEAPEPLQRLSDAPSEPPQRPPTGPGSPSAARGTRMGGEAAADRAPRRPAVLRLEPVPEWREERREAAQGRYNPRRVRTASAEAKARRAWAAGARTVGELVVKAGIGRSAASKYRRQFLAEISAQPEGTAL